MSAAGVAGALAVHAGHTLATHLVDAGWEALSVATKLPLITQYILTAWVRQAAIWGADLSVTAAIWTGGLLAFAQAAAEPLRAVDVQAGVVASATVLVATLARGTAPERAR